LKAKRPGYPFVPKSANWLIAGQFWALPLSDGTFGCARVVEVPLPENRVSRMEFLAGVLDWHGTASPTPESIAGARCLKQGHAHIRAITRTGGQILGIRDLAADGIEPWLFRGAEFWRNSRVCRGLIPIRPQTPDDDDLPVLSTWGYDVPLRRRGLTQSFSISTPTAKSPPLASPMFGAGGKCGTRLMDKNEARAILATHLDSFRARRYDELVALIGDVQVAEVVGRSGTEYQIEVEVRWDSPREKTDVRVLGAIDDGHLPGAIIPLCESFIVSPDGSSFEG
jgi:hypothetical protein